MTLRTNATINQHRQGWEYEEHREASVDGGRAGLPVFVRVRIHVDTSYAYQSHARLEAFDPVNVSWNVIATLHFRDIGTTITVVDPVDVAYVKLQATADLLYEKAEMFGVHTTEPQG